jgi:hypothetical protein
MLTARLSSDGSRVLCHIVDCGAEIAWVLEVGVYADGRWQRGLWFPPGWTTRPDGVWVWTARSVKRRRKGQAPADRQPMRGLRPEGQLPWNLPVEAKCPDCGFPQTLDPAVLRVNPNKVDLTRLPLAPVETALTGYKFKGPVRGELGSRSDSMRPATRRMLEGADELERWRRVKPKPDG